MNRDMRKTLVFVAVAALLSGAAFVTIPDRTGLHATFDDQGKKFFPELTDPNSCTSLEVVEYDAGTATALPFKVTQKDGKWIIPSHHDYPADARDRLSKTAGAVFDLVKDTIRSDRVEDHEKFGVVDPLDTKASSLKGQGKRITLRDSTNKVLADFIIGNEIKDRPGQRYVRVPSNNRTYGVKVGAELSTKFADWIETNLLKLDTSKIIRIKWDGTKVDPDQGVLIPGDKFVLERKDPSSPWTIPGLAIPDGQEIDPAKVNQVLTSLGDLKIVGVRTKPPGITRDLKALAQGGGKVAASTLLSLRDKGFHLARDGRVLSNQGEMTVETVEGAVYTLRFGEVSFATGEALTAGEGEDDPKAKAKAAEKKAASGEENRFVLVTASFDGKLVPEKPEPVGALVPLPKDVFARKPGTPEYEAQQKELNEERGKKQKERTDQLASEEKKAVALIDRFAPWYYVTPGASFRSLTPTKTELVHPKAPPAPEGGPPGGGNPFGGIPGMGGPGGFPGLPKGLPAGHP